MKQEEKHTDCVSLRAVSDYQKMVYLADLYSASFFMEINYQFVVNLCQINY